MLLKVLERNALKERRSTPLFSVVHHEIAMFYDRMGLSETGQKGNRGCRTLC
jgi:hypothetical protein